MPLQQTSDLKKQMILIIKSIRIGLNQRYDIDVNVDFYYYYYYCYCYFYLLFKEHANII